METRTPCTTCGRPNNNDPPYVCTSCSHAAARIRGSRKLVIHIEATVSGYFDERDERATKRALVGELVSNGVSCIVVRLTTHPFTDGKEHCGT